MKYSWVQFPRYQITRTQHFRKINPEEKFYHRKCTSSPGEKNCHFYRRNLGTSSRGEKLFVISIKKKKIVTSFPGEKKSVISITNKIWVRVLQKKNPVMIFITGTCASKF